MAPKSNGAPTCRPPILPGSATSDCRDNSERAREAARVCVGMRDARECFPQLAVKELSMRRVLRVVVGGALAVALAGCAATIPPKLQVRDTASGRTYTTYQPWGKVTKGVGYEFTDVETGNRLTLTNYEIKTIEGQKSVPGDSAEAKT